MPYNIDVGYNIQKKISEVILDPQLFREGEIKQIKVWSWRAFKHIIYLITFKNNKFIIGKLE